MRRFIESLITKMEKRFFDDVLGAAANEHFGFLGHHWCSEGEKVERTKDGKLGHKILVFFPYYFDSL